MFSPEPTWPSAGPLTYRGPSLASCMGRRTTRRNWWFRNYRNCLPYSDRMRMDRRKNHRTHKTRKIRSSGRHWDCTHRRDRRRSSRRTHTCRTLRKSSPAGSDMGPGSYCPCNPRSRNYRKSHPRCNSSSDRLDRSRHSRRRGQEPGGTNHRTDIVPIHSCRKHYRRYRGSTHNCCSSLRRNTAYSCMQRVHSPGPCCKKRSRRTHEFEGSSLSWDR
jgi:hypothetical protein